MHFSARGVAWRVNTAAIHLGKNELLGEIENLNAKSERLAGSALHWMLSPSYPKNNSDSFRNNIILFESQSWLKFVEARGHSRTKLNKSVVTKLGSSHDSNCGPRTRDGMARGIPVKNRKFFALPAVPLARHVAIRGSGINGSKSQVRHYLIRKKC